MRPLQERKVAAVGNLHEERVAEGRPRPLRDLGQQRLAPTPAHDEHRTADPRQHVPLGWKEHLPRLGALKLAEAPAEPPSPAPVASLLEVFAKNDGHAAGRELRVKAPLPEPALDLLT